MTSSSPTILELTRSGLHDETLKLVQTGKANVNETRDGSTPALLAAFRGWGDVVEALIEQGADFNVTSELGETPLMKAVRSGKCSRTTIQSLLNGSANKTINARASREAYFPGWTALHLAADAELSPDPGILALLLMAGADPTIECANGRTAKDVANEYPTHSRVFTMNPHDFLKEEEGNVFETERFETMSLNSEPSRDEDSLDDGVVSPLPTTRKLAQVPRPSRFSSLFSRGRAKGLPTETV